MKITIFVAAAILIEACHRPSPTAKDVKQEKAGLSLKVSNIATSIVPRSVELMVPGVRIGNITINGNADSVINLLGKPDTQNAAMGSSLMTWYVNHDTEANRTSIFFHRKFGSKTEDVNHISRILVTAPAFTTADGIHTGLSLREIKKQYALNPSGTYAAAGKQTITYEAASGGIAFEIDKLTGTCVAIIIHQPGPDNAGYVDMH